eukprot:NODE_65_length_23997_cov_0.327601.p3 type:complete len:504 gc:universal NODE_65_length_23997_cov_0.327601:10848-9337(-)
MILLVGTETNTAYKFAQQIQFQLQRKGHASEIKMANEQLIISDCAFIVSTYGQGEMPSSMKKLWARIMRRNADRIQANISIYGVGDSFYQQFNYAAKKLNRRLQQLGANVVLVLGDSQQGYASSLRMFCDHLLSKFDVHNDLGDMYKYNLDISDSQDSISYPNYIQLRVQVNNLLTPKDHFQKTHHIEFTTELLNLPGDVLNIMPISLTNEVEKVLQLTTWRRDELYKISNGYDTCPGYLLKSFSIEYILQYIVDIHTQPGPSFFYTLYRTSLLLKIDRKTEIADRLLALSEFDNMYTLYVTNPKRTAVEVLQDFPSIVKHLDPRHIFDLFPLQAPRQFSIASCKAGQMDICVAVVEYATSLKTKRLGACTQYLANLAAGDFVWCKLESHPLRVKAPVLMIATGTGIAIPRAIVQHLENSSNSSTLIFGCRYPEKDAYYKEELESKVKYIPVYSRVHHKYVQEVYNDLKMDLGQFANIVITGSKNLQDFQDLIKLKGVQYEIW